MYLFQNQFIVLAETIQIETKRGIFNRGGNNNVLIFQLHKNHYLYTDNTNKNDTNWRPAF